MTGILPTKLHAILDRGVRRDFFDLYVMLQEHRLGVASVLTAIRTVYQGQIDDALMLRALAPDAQQPALAEPLTLSPEPPWSALCLGVRGRRGSSGRGRITAVRLTSGGATTARAIV